MIGWSFKRCFRAMVFAVAATGISTSAHASQVLVSAAASLTDALRDVAKVYETAHPDVQITLTFAASDVLVRQIVHGAPVDIFLSADQRAMDKAVQAGVIQAGSRHDFVRNELVMVAPADDPAITGLDSLSDSSVTRVAYGNPASVPAGRYTREALKKQGAWDTVKNKQVLGQNVRQVLSYVGRGEVDAGFVFATDAAVRADTVRVVSTLSSPESILYPAALVQRDQQSSAAQDFLDYLLSDDAQERLKVHGFGAP